MPVLNFTLGAEQLTLRSDETEGHLQEVAELVKKKIENLQKKQTHLSLERASLMVALDLASELIKSKKASLEHHKKLIQKSNQILAYLQSELS